MSASPTTRIYLDELREDKHLEMVHSLWSKAENLEGMNFPAVPALEDNRTWLRKRSKVSHPDIENYVILAPPESPLYNLVPDSWPSLPNKHKFVGLTGIIRLSPPELGYIVAKPFWGKGIATEAASLLLELYWPKYPAVPAVYAMIDSGHVASETVAMRLGFSKDEAATVPAGGALPSGEVVERECGVWIIKRPASEEETGELG